MKIRILIVVFGILVTKTSCDNFKKNDHKEESVKTERFDDFYQKFYSDSLFQENRIIWPLKGTSLEWFDEKDSVVELSWKKSNFLFISDLKRAKQTIENSTWEIIDNQHSKIEKLYIKNSGFSIEREFKVENGKWYLSRYDYLNL